MANMFNIDSDGNDVSHWSPTETHSIMRPKVADELRSLWHHLILSKPSPDPLALPPPDEIHPWTRRRKSTLHQPGLFMFHPHEASGRNNLWLHHSEPYNWHSTCMGPFFFFASTNAADQGQLDCSIFPCTASWHNTSSVSCLHARAVG